MATSVAAAVVLQTTTTGTPVDSGLGRGLALAVIGLLGLFGGLTALFATLTLVLGRVVADALADWEVVALGAAAASGAYAAVRTVTLSGAGRYYLGTYAALAAVGLVAAWALLRVALWLRDAVRAESGPGSDAG
jgi:hypothetical protein